MLAASRTSARARTASRRAPGGRISRSIGAFEDLAKRLDLQITGGSDYHGTVKAKIRLGTGYEGNLNIPRSVLDKLREAVSA